MRQPSPRVSERVDPSQLGNAGSSRLINYDRIEIACNVLRDTGPLPSKDQTSGSGAARRDRSRMSVVLGEDGSE